MKEEKFPHTWKPLMGGVGGPLDSQRGIQQQVSEGKTEIIHHRDLAKQPFPVEKWPECLHSEWRLGMKAQALGVRLQGED